MTAISCWTKARRNKLWQSYWYGRCFRIDPHLKNARLALINTKAWCNGWLREITLNSLGSVPSNVPGSNFAAQKKEKQNCVAITSRSPHIRYVAALAARSSVFQVKTGLAVAVNGNTLSVGKQRSRSRVARATKGGENTCETTTALLK